MTQAFDNYLATQRREREWLSGLKVGDQVALAHAYRRGYEVLTITGETNTQWKVGYLNFRKADGRQIGGLHKHRQLHEVTAEIIAANERDELERQVLSLRDQLQVKRLKQGTLVALRNFLDNCVEEQKGAQS